MKIQKFKSICAGAFISLAAITTVQAEDNISKFSLGVQGGTMGLGVSGTYDISEYLSISGVYNQYDYKYNSTENDIDYRFKLGLQNTGLLAHFKPFQGNFRITGGIYHNNNDITGNARYSGSDSITIGNTTYNGSDIANIDADVSFSSVAPYLGVGYTKNISNFKFNADLGMLFQGSPKVGLNVNPHSSMDALTREELRAEVERERRSLEDELKDFKYYPVATIGIAYRF